ncbi:glucosidase II beta subunit-like-domain-containing protein [Tuber brumale]|nr:glucosidase II beta subunit-like-domain-containing protein [Tuber brumale]
MRRGSILLLLSSASIATASSAPRGVSPEDAKLYTSSGEKTFTCLTNPHVTIPYENVNDDYCDCPDGSDEPGTSACSHLPHKSLAIRGFYCKNEKHTPAFLPLGRVNDGICDYEICCDGSDEWAGAGGVKCENKCGEIGKAAAKLAAEKGRLRNEGVRKKKELLGRAKTMRIELEDNVKTTRVKIGALEEKVRRLEVQLKETEEEERLRMAKQPKEGSKLGGLVSLARERMQELKSSLEKVRDDRDSARGKLEKAEGILKALKEGYNPNFNDEGVKTAVRAWEEYLAQEGEHPENKAEERDLNNLLGEDEIDWEGFTEPDGVAEGSIRAWVHDKFADFRQMLVENGLLAAKSDDRMLESRALVSARQALETGRTEESDTKSRLETLLSDLTYPYGQDDIFRPLKGECISSQFGEYTYEYCFLGTAYQKSLKDSSSVSLGEYSRIEVDESINDASVRGIFESGWEEAHDEGLSGISLIHENGQQCWNGPRRSVKVDLYCSAVDELRSVREEEKCVYRFEVGTAAVCGGENVEENVRSEL